MDIKRSDAELSLEVVVYSLARGHDLMTRALGEGDGCQDIVVSSGPVMVHAPKPGRAQEQTGVGRHAHPGPDHLRGIIRPVPEHGVQAFGVLTAGPKGETSPPCMPPGSGR